MKKVLSKVAIALITPFFLVSCFTMKYDVGSGAQTGVKVEAKNHYVVNGLVPIKTANPTEMAGDAKNYTVTISHSFIDGLVNFLTWGIYNPVSVTVEK